MLILTTAIAAATVTFSVVDAVVLRSLPFEDSDRLVIVGPHRPYIRVYSAEDFRAWRDRADAFTALAATYVGPMAHVPSQAGVEYVRAWHTTASLFDVLRVRPIVGRLFTTEHEVEGRSAVAVISYGVWQRNFGGDPGVIGRSIWLANPRRHEEPASLVEIVGVVPTAFTADIHPDVWIPFKDFKERARFLRVIGRLRDGVTMEQAQAQIEGVTASLAAQKGYTLRDDWRPVLVSFYDTLVDDVRSWMLLVLLAAGLVMLVACVNVANLLLARSASRSREFAIRASLGASPGQLVASLLGESLMLSLAAAAFGILVAYWGVGLATAALPGGIPRASDIAIDFRVLAVAVSSAVAAGVFFGVVPAWYAARIQPGTLLTRGTPMLTPGHTRWRGAFIVAEVALVAALLVVSTLFVASFVRVVRTDLGFARSDVATFELDGYGGSAATILDALRGTPGVASVAELTGSPPLVMSAFGGSQASTRLQGVPTNGVTITPTMYRVSPEYFGTAGIKLVRGRTFTEADALAPVAIIDELAAQVLFADGIEPIGSTVTRDLSSPPLTVVGIVRTVRADGPETLSGTQLYLPKSGQSGATSQFLVRTSRRAADVIPAILASLGQVLPAGVAVPPIQSLDEAFRVITAGRRYNATLMSICGLVVLLIGAAGVYAVMTSVVAQQQRELGVRMALGATRGRIIRGVLARAGTYLAAGLVVGLVAGRALSDLFAALLFEVRPTDLPTYAIVAALLLTVGLVAALVPALVASRVDPIVTLRAD